MVFRQVEARHYGGPLRLVVHIGYEKYWLNSYQWYLKYYDYDIFGVMLTKIAVDIVKIFIILN